MEFSSRRGRGWFEYTWARDGLSEGSVIPCTITEVDIENWEELIRIARQGDSATEKQRNAIEFEPCIAYPVLQSALGSATLNRFKEYHSGKDFSDDDKKAVLAALNRIILPANALVENPHITYGPWRWHLVTYRGLCLADKHINDGFEEVKLAQQLLADGVLTLAADGGHLKIKTTLNERERAQVQWLHIGLLRFICGNLVYKQRHSFESDLGGHWYFGRS